MPIATIFIISVAKVRSISEKSKNLLDFSDFYHIFAWSNLSLVQMRTLITLLLSAVTLGMSAQKERPWNQYLNEVMTAEDAESASWEETYDLLCELEQHPLDINLATREQLEELPFLSAQQVEGIMEYRDRYGFLKSLGELQMIPALDYRQLQLLPFFVYVGEEPEAGFPSLKAIAKYGKQELTATMRVPFYERKGDKEGYLGYPYRHWLRYQFTYGDNLKFGLVGAQDAGEPFFSNRNRWGYDYYAPYLQIRKLGRLESFVAGKYRVSLGMGLVLNNSFGLGKLSMLQNLGRPTYSLRAHSSRSTDYLQGVAATVDVTRSLKATAFISDRPMDATLNKTDSTVATILTTDYHRTETEMGKKHNLHQTAFGGSLRYSHNGLRFGANVLVTHYDRRLEPNTTILYRQHYPQGRDFLNASIDYGYVRPRVSLFGETALDGKGHLATINSLSLQLCESLNLLALQRFYSYSYTALMAQSYSDGGKTQNESGVYLGLTWQPSSAFRLVAYTDYAYFAWARYRVSQSSYSFDNLLQTTYTHHNWTLGARYRLRMKQRDNDDKTALLNLWEHRGRLTADYASPSGWGFRTQLDGGYGASNDEWGIMLSEHLSFTHRWLRLNAAMGYFHTDSYDSRVYLYERSPLYTYNCGQFYGEGIRYWLMARANIGNNLLLTAKVGVTDYFDRRTIGSSYQQIAASSQCDLDLQLRWKF